ncbi:MAG: DNA-3-methyladenine glycosylase [Candidatus Dormibacteraceae bacterium]
MSRVPLKHFDIAPQGDYSLEESANFVGAWHKAPSDSGGPDGHLHLAFLTDGDWMPVGVCLQQDAGGGVKGTVYGGAASELVKQVERILSLDIDGRGWPEVGKRDPVVAKLQRMFPGFRPVNWSNAYEAAAWCIISTRISMRQGQRVQDRMSREHGRAIDVHGDKLWTFPGPDRLAHLQAFPGLFGRKVEYLNALGRAALAGEVDTETLREMPREEALKRLTNLPGIGKFGSELVRLRALSAVDELPTQERRLMGALQTAYGLPREPDQQKLEELAKKWAPFQMWVCVCLRRTLEGGAGMTHSRAAR